MNYLSDNIDDNLKTTNPKAYHWREMYLRQVELYNLMLKEKEDKYEKILNEKEKILNEKDKMLAEKDKRLAEKDDFISLLRSKTD
jgi:hypothetical protein